MPISENFHSIYKEDFIVDYFDCQPNGQIKVVDLCKLMQITSSNHAVLGGISYWDLQKTQQAWVLNRFRLHIDKMPTWQEHITIQTWIQSLDGVRSIRNFQVLLDDKVIASASSLWVTINTNRRRPETMKINHDHFIKYQDKKVFEQDFTKFSSLTQDIEIDQGTVKYSDLDMLNHVTNTKYLEWIVNALHHKDMVHKDIKVIDMVFQKELLFRDLYTVVKNRDLNTHYVIKDNNQNINFQCLIQ